MYTTVFGEERKYNIYKHSDESEEWWRQQRFERYTSLGGIVSNPSKTVDLIPIPNDVITNIKKEMTDSLEKEFLENSITDSIKYLSKEEFKELEHKEIMLEWERLINEDKSN